MGFNPSGGKISGASDVGMSNPVNGQTLVYDNTTQLWRNNSPVISSTNISDATAIGQSLITATDAADARAAIGALNIITSQEVFTYTGTLTTMTGTQRLYNDSGFARTIKMVRISVGTTPAGATIIVDVNKGGSTIFTGAQPTINIGSYTAAIQNMNYSWNSGSGSYLTIDIDQVGSTTPGADLTVSVIYTQ